MKNLFQILLFPFLIMSSGTVAACLPTADAQSTRPIGTLPVEVRTDDYPVLLTVPNTGANANDITAGVNGVIAVYTPTTDGGVEGFGGDASFATLPYPCKLQAVWKDHPDSGASGTAACSGTVKFRGIDQFGELRDEESTTTDLTEAGAGVLKTERVYEELQHFSAATCSGIDINDRLQISCSPEIGVSRKVDTKTRIKAVCRSVPTEGTPNTFPTLCYSQTSLTYDTNDYAVRLDNISGGPDAGVAYSNGDRVIVRLRAPAY